MARNIGDLGQITTDFSNSVSEIFGGEAPEGSSNDSDKGGEVTRLDTTEKWRGKYSSQVVRYGFVQVDAKDITGSSGQLSANPGNTSNQFFLQIPPQSIQQKELFSNNIRATRKGVIVESEGVVFKDIVIKGKTGVFPGKRGEANNLQPAGDITEPPTASKGVNSQGKSTSASGSNKISGYEEFLRLRKFFLNYAESKLDKDGDRFLVFVNEKDGEDLLVEPMEFTMDRSANSPMTYDYTIVLKCIGTLDLIVNQSGDGDDDSNDLFDTLEDIGNISANIQARIQQARGVINRSRQFLERINQAIDATFIDPLKQVEFATQDLAEGLSTVFSLPEILYRNASTAILNIRENLDDAGNTLSNFGNTPINTTNNIQGLENTQEFNNQRDIVGRISSDSRIAIPRSFVSNLKENTRELASNVADAINLGSPGYNDLYNRTRTQQPNPTRQPTDEEVQLLGALNEVKASLDLILSNNRFFESDPEDYYSQIEDRYGNLVDSLPAPTSVREITVEQNDTLERIAQRELADATRWLELVVLNDLKPPYLSSSRSPGVKIPGDPLLVPEV